MRASKLRHLGSLPYRPRIAGGYEEVHDSTVTVFDAAGNPKYMLPLHMYDRVVNRDR